MKKLMLTMLAVAALAIPAAAVAKGGPGHGGGHGNGHGHGVKPVRYDLRGTLSAFTAAAGATNGSITILVTRVQKGPKALVGQTLTFVVSAATKVEPRGAAIADGDRGKVRLEGAPDLDATALQALVPTQIQDESADGAEDR